jgi:hypothetical protein
MVRALFGKYTGPLYMVQRASDYANTSIGVLAAGAMPPSACLFSTKSTIDRRLKPTSYFKTQFENLCLSVCIKGSFLSGAYSNMVEMRL